MTGPITVALQADHRRLGALLDRAVADPDRFDHDAFEAFRAGLLRHIGIEEKILLPEARRRRGGEPLPIAARLREDHGVLGALLVPTPGAALVAEIRGLLAEHDALEEAPGGVYEVCDGLCSADTSAVLERIAAAPAVPLAAHFDGRGTHRTVASARAMLRAPRGRDAKKVKGET